MDVDQHVDVDVFVDLDVLVHVDVRVDVTWVERTDRASGGRAPRAQR